MKTTRIGAIAREIPRFEIQWLAITRDVELFRASLSLLASAELSFELETAAEVALALYQRARADFADCVHVALAYAAGESPL